MLDPRWVLGKRNHLGKVLERGIERPSLPTSRTCWATSNGTKGYQSLVGQEDLSLVRVGYCILGDYKIELLGPDMQIDNPPPGRLGVYEEVFEVELKFSLNPFVLELLRVDGISLCALTPNLIRHIIGFLRICFLAKVKPSLPLFCFFFTTQRHP